MGLVPFWDCGFESRQGCGRLCLAIVGFCQVEVSMSGRSLVQRSPTECGVPEYDREASIFEEVLAGSNPARGVDVSLL